MATPCPHCDYWRDLVEKAIAHAQTYGPRISDLTLENQRFGDVLARLDSLYRHLDGEDGWRVYANTAELAIEEIKRLRYLEQCQAHLDAGGKPTQPTS